MKQLVVKVIILIVISEINCSKFVARGSAANETQDASTTSSVPGLLSRTGSSQPATSTQSSIDQTSESPNSPRERSDNQDPNAQISTASVVQNHNHHQHPNHQNYPLDPYPSSGYSSSNPNTSYQLNNFLNRDHHQSSSIVQASQINESASGANNLISNSFVNQAPTASNAVNRNPDHLTPESYNHNYNIPSSSTLNTGLIQNLTASLFPIKQLSNGTLVTLSELLNKTRHPMNSYGKLSFGGFSTIRSQPIHQQPVSNSQLNHADSRANEVQYSIFDYLRPNQYRADSVSQRHHQASMLPFFSQSSAQPKMSSSSYTFVNQNIQPTNLNQGDGGVRQNYKNPNIYSAINSFKDNMNTLPTITNGQSLNMGFYDGYSFDNGYRLPLLMGNLKGILNHKPLVNYGSVITGSSSGPTMTGTNQGSLSSAYQYVQHHNANNQNHLDKIVYHSTPFRPSIVNPPNGKPQTSSSSQSTGSLFQAGLIKSMSGVEMSPKLKSGGSEPFKAITFSSLENPISDSRTEFANAANRPFNATRFLKDPSFGRQTEANEPQTTTVLPPSDDFDFESKFSGNTTVITLNTTDHNVATSNSSKSSSSINPAILFDLYEREIDNQIREALYSTEHPLLSATRSPQNQWFEKTPTPLFEDNDHAMSSWARPVALGSQITSYIPRIRRPPPIDHLTAALHELPTFAASDLQQNFPAGPTYSILPPHSAHHETYPDSQSMASITSQLYSVDPSNAMSTLIDTDAVSKPNIQHLHHHQPSNAPGAPTPQSGFPAILLKLNSNSLSSLLMNPLAHLYASLPGRNRNKKPANNNNHNNLNHLQQSTNQFNHFISPNSLFSFHPLGGVTGKSLFGSFSGSGISGSNLESTILPQKSQHRKAKHRNQGTSGTKYQLQQAAIEAATANILTAAAASAAAEGNQISPLQAALIQSHAVKSIGNYLTNQDHEPLIAASNNLDHQSTNSATGPTYESSSGDLGLVSGSITPVLLRNFLSPAHWARKQSITSSGQTPIQHATGSLLPSSFIPSFTHYGSHHKSNNNNNNNHNSNYNNQVNSNNRHHHLSSLLGGSLTTQLFSPVTSASSNSVQFATMGTGGISSVQNGLQPNILRKPKLEIKILKIPVAFFDQPTTSSQSREQSSAVGLIPAPSSLAASILAHIPCTLNHNPARQPHYMDQHIMSPATSLALSTMLSPPPASTSATSQHLSPNSNSASSAPQTLNSGPILSIKSSHNSS